jgi:hypothetical protein
MSCSFLALSFVASVERAALAVVLVADVTVELAAALVETVKLLIAVTAVNIVLVK